MVGTEDRAVAKAEDPSFPDDFCRS